MLRAHRERYRELRRDPTSGWELVPTRIVSPAGPGLSDRLGGPEAGCIRLWWCAKIVANDGVAGARVVAEGRLRVVNAADAARSPGGEARLSRTACAVEDPRGSRNAAPAAGLPLR